MKSLKMHIHLIPALKDNYIYLLHEEAGGETAVVDPSLAEPVLQELDRRGWKLSKIFNTHHHWDHTNGNLPLKEITGAKIYGYAPDAERIHGIDVMLEDGDEVRVGHIHGKVMYIPGHTLGHIAFYFEHEQALFCGDTLFSIGCGRLFEGSPQQMHTSLQKLAALPEETRIFCGHEYTQANIAFAETLEPGNAALIVRNQQVERLRKEGQPTIPSTMAMELAANPFLRSGSAEIRKSLGMEQASDVEVFAELRARKNSF